jgi:hypothetical protein
MAPPAMAARRADTVTTTPIPKLLKSPEAREQLVYGLENATGALGAFWPELDGMGEDDMRWDELSERAIARALPDIAALLDTALAREWADASFSVALPA